MGTSEFEHKLEQYADVLIRVGLNLKPGQRLLIGPAGGLTAGVPLEAAPMVRLLAAKAYQAGARYVEVNWADRPLILTRMAHAPRDSFDEVSDWKYRLTEQFGRRGDALLSLGMPDPDLLAGQDQDLVNRRLKAMYRAAEPGKEVIRKNLTNWLVAAVPSPQWAAKVLPDVPESERVMALWETVFRLCRVDGEDPVSAWRAHVAGLAARANYLNRKRYKALHYTAPGTALKIGLPEGHIWRSGSMTAQTGITFTPNIPTEEVFTLAHRERVSGTVTASRPLNLGGSMVEGFRLTFEDGRGVRAEAERGGDLLDTLLNSDEGARTIGEVALVPHSSPISQSGLVFHNTLYDENASSHLALGSAYRFSLEGGESMTDEEFAAAGGSNSIIHVDFMVGSGEMDIEGILPDGRVEPVMQRGEWAFEV